jgi:hypothetical protein
VFTIEYLYHSRVRASRCDGIIWHKCLYVDNVPGFNNISKVGIVPRCMRAWRPPQVIRCLWYTEVLPVIIYTLSTAPSSRFRHLPSLYSVSSLPRRLHSQPIYPTSFTLRRRHHPSFLLAQQLRRASTRTTHTLHPRKALQRNDHRRRPTLIRLRILDFGIGVESYGCPEDISCCYVGA